MSDDEREEKDYFSYLHARDYSVLVNNKILPLATADLWRHEFSAICRVNDLVFRVSLKKCLFPGRCFDCKLNLKSACFCFWGQNTKDCESQDELPVAFVERITAWRDYIVNIKRQDLSVPREVFPDMDVMFPPKSLRRIPEQHMIPPLAPLILQKPFRDVVPVTTFNSFIMTRQVYTDCVARKKRRKYGDPVSSAESFEWKESGHLFQRGGKRLQTVMCLNSDSALIGEMEKREALVEMLENMRADWSNALCKSDCDVLSGCPRCTKIRQYLKKRYKEGIRQACTHLITSLLLQKKFPFGKAPAVNSSLYAYEDDDCRVTRVLVEDDSI